MTGLACALLCLALTQVCEVGPAPTSVYTYTDLGTLAGTDRSLPAAFSKDGRVVCRTWVDNTGSPFEPNGHAGNGFYWDQTTSRVDLGAPGDGAKVNANGVVVGALSTGPFIWDTGNRQVALVNDLVAEVQAGWTIAGVTGLDNNDRIVGAGYYAPADPTVFRGFIAQYNRTSATIDWVCSLGMLPGGGDASRAGAISDSGMVAGNSRVVVHGVSSARSIVIRPKANPLAWWAGRRAGSCMRRLA